MQAMQNFCLWLMNAFSQWVSSDYDNPVFYIFSLFIFAIIISIFLDIIHWRDK